MKVCYKSKIMGKKWPSSESLYSKAETEYFQNMNRNNWERHNFHPTRWEGIKVWLVELDNRSWWNSSRQKRMSRSRLHFLDPTTSIEKKQCIRNCNRTATKISTFPSFRTRSNTRAITINRSSQYQGAELYLELELELESAAESKPAPMVEPS